MRLCCWHAWLCPLLFLLSLHTTSAQEDDLYEILGIDESATEREIKNGYRKRSLATHPDKGGDAAEFKKVSEAYEILSSEEKRTLYDAGGMKAVAQGAGATDPWGRPVGVTKGKDSTITVKVPLEEIYAGGSVRIKVHRRVVCRGCASKRGRGTEPERCLGCSATCPPTKRMVQRRMGPLLMNEEVEEPSKEFCKIDAKVLVAEIERGAPEDSEIQFPRASEQSPGRIPGHVRVRLRAAKHAVMRRNGTELYMTLRLPLRDALLGFERTIRHFDGHPVVIRHGPNQVASHGQTLRLKGEGMPVHGVPSEFGDLHVTLAIAMPKAITQEERIFVERHFIPEKEERLGAEMKPR